MSSTNKPKGYSRKGLDVLAQAVEALTADPFADLAAVAQAIGVSRQAVYRALRTHRPDLLASRARPGARKTPA